MPSSRLRQLQAGSHDRAVALYIGARSAAASTFHRWRRGTFGRLRSLVRCSGLIGSIGLPVKGHPGAQNIFVQELSNKGCRELHSKLFCSYASDDFSSFVARAGSDAGLNLKLKDDREPYAIQLAGSNAALGRLACIVGNVHPGFETTSTRIFPTDAGHTNPEDYYDVRDAFSLLQMRPPRFEIMTHTDGAINRHVGAVPLSTVLFNTLCAPLSTGKVNRYLQSVSYPIIYLGSRQSARFVFYGFGPSKFSSPCYHWEDVLLSDDALTPLALPQDALNW